MTMSDSEEGTQKTGRTMAVIRKETIFKNLPLPLFAKEGY
jgi:hypothetical protein